MGYNFNEILYQLVNKHKTIIISRYHKQYNKFIWPAENGSIIQFYKTNITQFHLKSSIIKKTVTSNFKFDYISK